MRAFSLFHDTSQVELYSHIPVVRRLIEALQMWGFKVCGTYLIDATFISDASKFISGALLALSAMLMVIFKLDEPP